MKSKNRKYESHKSTRLEFDGLQPDLSGMNWSLALTVTLDRRHRQSFHRGGSYKDTRHQRLLFFNEIHPIVVRDDDSRGGRTRRLRARRVEVLPISFKVLAGVAI